MTDSLRPFVLVAKLAFYRWARHDMPPTHPDLPLVVHAINELERALAGQLWLRQPFTVSDACLAIARRGGRALWRLV